MIVVIEQMNPLITKVLGVVSSLFILSLYVGSVESTIPLVVGTATILTAEQLSALVAIGLAVKAVTLKASLISAVASRGRGRREAIAAEEELDIETLVVLEEEDCYKRIFCAAATDK